jgi:hypothetical protein
MAQVPPLGYKEHWRIELEFLRAESKPLSRKHPEAKDAIEKVHNVFSDTASLVGCTPKKIWESDAWIFSALYGVYIMTQSELKAVLQYNAARKAPPPAQTAKDEVEFREQRRRKRVNSSEDNRPAPPRSRVHHPNRKTQWQHRWSS